MGSRSNRHVRFSENQASYSRSPQIDQDPPLQSPPPEYSYFDPNYLAEEADAQRRQQEDRDRRRQRPEMAERQPINFTQQAQAGWRQVQNDDRARQRPEMAERQPFLGAQQADAYWRQREYEGRERQLPEMAERQTFVRAQHDEIWRRSENMDQQLYDRSIAEGINTGEYRFPIDRQSIGVNNDPESFYQYAPSGTQSSTRTTTYNRGGFSGVENIDTGEYRFPDIRPLARANNDQEVFNQHPPYTAGPSTRPTIYNPGGLACVDDATQTEEINSTTNSQPLTETNRPAQTTPDDPSSPFQEIEGEDRYDREKRHHSWRWGRRVIAVREGRQHDDWYKHARAFQKSFEKKTLSQRAKREIMPWTTHLGRGRDDFGRGL